MLRLFQRIIPAQWEHHRYMQTSTIIVAAIIVVLTALAWSNRFIQDDAFISFRYADNLVSGHGLVWNAGERIEGYTNFLWTLLMVVPLALKLDPVPVSFIVGLILFACSLIMTYRCANLIFDSKWDCIVGRATETAVPIRNAVLLARRVTSRIQRPVAERSEHPPIMVSLYTCASIILRPAFFRSL